MIIGKEIDFEIIFIQHKYSRPLTGGIHCSFMCEIIERPTEELTLEERVGVFYPICCSCWKRGPSPPMIQSTLGCRRQISGMTST